MRSLRVAKLRTHGCTLVLGKQTLLRVTKMNSGCSCATVVGLAASRLHHLVAVNEVLPVWVALLGEVSRTLSLRPLKGWSQMLVCLRNGLVMAMMSSSGSSIEAWSMWQATLVACLAMLSQRCCQPLRWCDADSACRRSRVLRMLMVRAIDGTQLICLMPHELNMHLLLLG